MAIETAIKIDIEVLNDGTVKEAAGLYKDLGDAVSQTQLRAEELAKKHGILDARTQEAIKVAGKYKAEMEQLDFAIEAAKGGSDQLFRATQGVVGGFEAAVGAMALFGGESEELEAALLKVQGAMALSQGLKDFNEFLPAIKNVTKSVAGPLISAFKSFGTAAKAAIASTGIGLLVVAVGTLVAYWDDIKAAVSGVSEEQKKLLKDQELSVAASKKKLEDISAQENILRQQGKTEEEILNMKILGTKEAITDIELNIKKQKVIREQQIETARRNKDILSGILKFVEAPLYILLKGIDVALNAFGKESDLANQFADFGASLLFDPDQVEEEANAAIEAQEKELMTLKNNLAGYEMNITKIHREESEKRMEQMKKENEERQKQLAHLKYVADETAKSNELVGKELNKVTESTQKPLEMFTINFERRATRQMGLLEKLGKFASAYGQEVSQGMADGLKAVGELANAFAGEDEARQKRAFEISKRARIAQAIISSIEGVQNAYTTAQASPLTTVFPAYPILQAATAAAFGLAQIKQIQSSQFKSSKTPSAPRGGGARPGVPQMAAPRLGGVLNPDNEITQQRKVYVVESDITSTQAKVSNTQKVSLVE